MQVSSEVASQKTTSSGTPADKSATFRSIADGSFIRSPAGQIYTVKKVIVFFPVPSQDVTNQTFLAGNNLIIPSQGEIG
jgi:hypothetical protein